MKEKEIKKPSTKKSTTKKSSATKNATTKSEKVKNVGKENPIKMEVISDNIKKETKKKWFSITIWDILKQLSWAMVLMVIPGYYIFCKSKK